MNLDGLNKWLALLGNLGVIMGIVFLAVEIQQNTDMMRAQTRDALTQNIGESLLAISTDEFASDIWFRGMTGEIQPSSDGRPASREWVAFQMMTMTQFRNWENEWYQFQQGLFEVEEFEPRTRIWQLNFSSPGYMAVWEIRKGTFSDSFRELIDGLIEEM